MAGAQQLGDIGTRLDLLMREATTYGPVRIQLKQPGQLPLDLTDCEVRGSVRRRQTDTTPLATFQVSIANPPSGSFVFGLSSQQTAQLAGDRSYNPLKLVWDMVLVDANGYIRPLFYGDVTLHLGGRHGG